MQGERADLVTEHPKKIPPEPTAWASLMQNLTCQYWVGFILLMVRHRAVVLSHSTTECYGGIRGGCSG